MRLYRYRRGEDGGSCRASGNRSESVGLIASCASCAFFALLLFKHMRTHILTFDDAASALLP